MRGNSGADFENEAIVTRGTGGEGLFSCFGFTKRQKAMYILVKGPHLFVYSKATSSAPMYSIPLKRETVNVHEIKGHYQVVGLENALGDVQYEFKFDLKENNELGSNFGRVLEEQIALGNTDEVKEVSYTSETFVV